MPSRRCTTCSARTAFGDASARVVIEEFLDGEEASYIVMSDGSARAADGLAARTTSAATKATSAPTPAAWARIRRRRWSRREVEQRILREVIEPTLRGMAAEGAPFIGFLYAGLMIDKTGAPKVIEFNVRFGDPETQPIMLRLNSDLVDLIDAALDGRLERTQARMGCAPVRSAW